MARQIAHENFVDIDVERNIGLACAQGGQLFLGAGGSEVSPMVEDVNFVSFAQSGAARRNKVSDGRRFSAGGIAALMEVANVSDAANATKKIGRKFFIIIN